jgi:hypothetical protein
MFGGDGETEICGVEASLIPKDKTGGEEAKLEGLPLNGGRDLAQSLVYCAAVFVADPNADRIGEVIGCGEAEVRRLEGVDLAICLGYIRCKWVLSPPYASLLVESWFGEGTGLRFKFSKDCSWLRCL